MTFDNLDRSSESGLPISLYLITYGTGANDFFAYTDHDREVTYLGRAYQPVPIGRAGSETTGNIQSEPFFIDVAPDLDIVDYMAMRTPTQDVRMEIRQGHHDDPDMEYLVVWSGRLTGFERKGATVRLGGELTTASLRRPALKRQYQRGCNWALYAAECNALRNIRNTVVPAIVGRNLVVLAPGWNGALDPGKFKGGYLTWDSAALGGTHSRTILDVAGHAQGHRLLLQGDTDGLDPGERVNLFAGCNHQFSDCKDIHNNIANFGGQWAIPLENPVGFVNRFF